eukprot:1430701-Prymnesium_polylepis.1
MMRARAVCKSGPKLVRLQEMLMRGRTLEVEVGGQVWRVEIKCARNKNKFPITGDDFDPMHFRNILNNLTFLIGERSVFVELQVHHKAIYSFNELSHAHDRFNYFRSELKGLYVTGLDQALERVFNLYEEASGVPVLLAMLVLVFGNRSGVDAIPGSRLELYQLASRATIKKRCGDADAADGPVAEMVLRVAVRAHSTSKQRGFDGGLVAKALEPMGREAFARWNAMAAEAAGLPLFKVLELGSAEQDHTTNKYQAMHLSFQEGLFAHGL